MQNSKVKCFHPDIYTDGMNMEQFDNDGAHPCSLVFTGSFFSNVIGQVAWNSELHRNCFSARIPLYILNSNVLTIQRKHNSILVAKAARG